MHSSVVYVVAKAPRSGAAKTRLAPMLSNEEAAEVARGFLLDTFLLARRARGVAVRAVCRDPLEARAVRELGGPSLDVLCQRAPGLGAALEACFHHGLADEYGAVAVLGADSPTLLPEIVEQAFAALGNHDVAIGPSEDGGYYLLAARAIHPMLFREMVWSTDRVCRDTLERCAEAGLRAALLPEWYDVDTPRCLRRLARELETLPANVAPNTRRALAEIAFAPVSV